MSPEPRPPSRQEYSLQIVPSRIPDSPADGVLPPSLGLHPDTADANLHSFPTRPSIPESLSITTTTSTTDGPKSPIYSNLFSDAFRLAPPTTTTSRRALPPILEIPVDLGGRPALDLPGDPAAMMNYGPMVKMPIETKATLPHAPGHIAPMDVDWSPQSNSLTIDSGHPSSPHPTSFQLPPSVDQDDEFRPRSSFNPYKYPFNPYKYSFNPYTSSSPFNFASLLPAPSQPSHQSTNGYLISAHSWSAPSPHLARQSSNPEPDRHPASKSEEQVDSWAFPQYTPSNSLTNGLEHPPSLSPISSPPAPAVAMAERPKGKRGKLPKPVTDYLKDWLYRNSDHPYPSEDEKKQLCQATGLSMSQMSNWMINVCQFSPRSIPIGRLPLTLGPPSDPRTSPACTGERCRFI